MLIPARLDAKVEVKVDATVGESSIEKLIDAAIDAFSPATETLGLLGDAIRLARVEVAARVTRRAKAIADEQGLKLAAPPLKFLIPFYEKSSTEDPADDALIEMWAHLLTSAGSAYDARQLRYVSLLSEIGSAHAKILDGIAKNFDGTVGINVDPDRLVYDLVESRLISTLKAIASKKVDEIFDKILDEIAVPGVSIVLVQVELKSSGKKMHDWADDSTYDDKKAVDFEIIRSLGLIDKVSTEFFEIPHAFISVILYHISELGIDFWRACSGNKDVAKYIITRRSAKRNPLVDRGLKT